MINEEVEIGNKATRLFKIASNLIEHYLFHSGIGGYGALWTS
jgi:hypothetical protein